MAGFSARSWLTTTTPSAVSPTSSSNERHPRARHCRNPSTEFSGNRPRAPRWPMTSICRVMTVPDTVAANQHGKRMMDYTTLGRTGLRVSVAGLGTGGFSRIGIGQSEEHAIGIIRQALDLGV